VRRQRAYARVVPDPIGPDIGDGVAERIDAAAAARRAALAVADLPAEQREVLLLSCVGFGWYEGRAMGQRKGEWLRVRLVRKC
jgi:DNA-directed RNA polymerase specialized sigma24 family protein